MLSTVLSILLSIFTPPVDYEISLAGNFGEPRPNHFHGGLDIKTDGVEGKHIYAIGDGYVSRVTCGLYGFGNAVYITHPTGHTSVYCHLKSFSPRIQAALRRYQYRHQTSVADARLSPLDVPVSQGQFIALSGNTGHSTAPHLHLEVHDTRSWDMLDPYAFLNESINDSVAPQAHAFMAIPQDAFSRFNGSSRKSPFSILNTQLKTAWGRVGFAVWADDYMQGSYNHYGIRETLLTVDGQQVFHSCVDRIPVEQNRMVNSWGDYDHYRVSHVWYMKSYIEPGNTLGILRANENRGIVDFNEERDYHLEYILRDFKGNESHYPFVIRGVKPAGPLSPARGTAPPYPVFHWNRTNTYSRPGMQLVVPYGLLTTDVELTPTVISQQDGYSNAYSFAAVSLPLMADAELSIYVGQHRSTQIEKTELQSQGDESKYYIADELGRFMGGTYQDGWVTGHIRELASRYHVAYDETPPQVRLLSQGVRIALSVIDQESGIDSWTATLDGRFVVFDAIEKSSTFACDLSQSPVPPTGKPRRLVFSVTDRRQNTQTFEATVNY